MNALLLCASWVLEGPISVSLKLSSLCDFFFYQFLSSPEYSTETTCYVWRYSFIQETLTAYFKAKFVLKGRIITPLFDLVHWLMRKPVSCKKNWCKGESREQHPGQAGVLSVR